MVQYRRVCSSQETEPIHSGSRAHLKPVQKVFCRPSAVKFLSLHATAARAFDRRVNRAHDINQGEQGSAARNECSCSMDVVTAACAGHFIRVKVDRPEGMLGATLIPAGTAPHRLTLAQPHLRVLRVHTAPHRLSAASPASPAGPAASPTHLSAVGSDLLIQCW